MMAANFRQAWYAPVFSSVLENRKEGSIIFGAGAVHLGLTLAGLPGWTCPIRALTGVPCPGCGLTHAVLQILQGDVISSLQTHAFAPVALLAPGVMLAALVLPERYRQGVISIVSNLEVRGGLTSLILSALMLYWAIRLMGVIPFPEF